ncbi:MAG: hypothetical protein ACR2PL_15790 [Dehalococcoidia bacterium]
MNPTDGPRESFWDLMNDLSRLQREMGADLAAWSQVYDAAGQALQSQAQTLNQMAELGRRMERSMRDGPPATVRQALQLLVNPWHSFAGSGGTTAADPFARFWEIWAVPESRSSAPVPPVGDAGRSADAAGSDPPTG